MDVRKQRKQSKRKVKVKKSERPPIIAQPAPFPIFPFGLFLLPLIVPGMSPAAPKDAKNQNKSPISQ